MKPSFALSTWLLVAAICINPAVALAASPATVASCLAEIGVHEDERDISSLLSSSCSKHEAAVVRARVALALGRIQSSKGIELLKILMTDKAPKVVGESAFALGQLGWSKNFNDGRNQELAQFLSSDEFLFKQNVDNRVLIIEAIGKLAQENASAILENLLSDAHSRIVEATITALFRARMVFKTQHSTEPVPPTSALVFKQLGHLLSHPSVKVHRAALYYMARASEPTLADILIQFVSRNDQVADLYFLQAVGRLKLAQLSESNLAKLSKMVLGFLNSDSHETLLAAINDAGALGLLSELPVGLMEHSSFHVRTGLAVALKLHKDLALAEKTLNVLASDLSPTVRSESYKSLIALFTKDAGRYLEKAVSDPSWVVRASVPGMLGSLEAAQREDWLLKLAGDADSNVRANAYEGLAEFQTSESLKILQIGLQAKSIAERGSAVTALVEHLTPETLTWLWQTYQKSGQSIYRGLRETLAEGFGKIVSPETTLWLRALVEKDPDYGVALLAWKKLKERSITDVAEPKLRLTYSPFKGLKTSSHPIVRVETEYGDFKLVLFADAAPIHVSNFVGQIKAGLYNGLPWHRVVSNFVVQGGDPDGSGWGDAGYSLRAEVNHHKFDRGALGMPRSQDFDSGGVQIFVNHVATPHLDGQYTVFGKVIMGLEIIDRLQVGDNIKKITVEVE